MGKLEVSLLGPIKVFLEGAEITQALRTRKERALLAYLAEENRHALPREQVAEFLWPERPEGYARMNLRQALLGIRRAFGTEEKDNCCLLVTEDTIQVNRQDLILDSQRFSQSLQFVKDHDHTSVFECTACIQSLEQALVEYRGEFLQDMVLGDAQEFQEWVVIHRERYYSQVLNTVQLLSEIYFRRAEYQPAYTYAWRHLELAPLEESAHRLLMRLLALSGRRNAALQQYETCRALVQRDLGIAPSAETRRLYEQIKNEHTLTEADTRPLFGQGAAVQRPAPAEPALYDPMTRLPTRPLFMDRLAHGLLRMARDQQMAGVCRLMVDLPADQDLPADLQRQALQIAIRRIIGCMRQADTVALLGEQEFGLLLENIHGAEDLALIAGKLVRTVERPVSLLGRQVSLHAVLGGSIYPSDGREAENLLNLAEAAVQAARLKKQDYALASSS